MCKTLSRAITVFLVLRQTFWDDPANNFHLCLDLLFQRVFESGQQVSGQDTGLTGDLAQILPAIHSFQSALAPQGQVSDKASSWEDVMRIINAASDDIKAVSRQPSNAGQDQGTETENQPSPLNQRMVVEAGPAFDDDIMASQSEENWISNYRDTSSQDLVTTDLNLQYESVMKHVGHLSEAFMSWRDQFMKLQKHQMSGFSDIETIDAFEQICEDLEHMITAASSLNNSARTHSSPDGGTMAVAVLAMMFRLKMLVSSVFIESQMLVKQNEYLLDEFGQAVETKKRLLHVMETLSELKQSVSDKDHAINFYSNEVENAKLILNQSVSHIESLNSLISDKSTFIEKLESEIASLKSDIGDYEVKLSHIESKALEVERQKELLKSELSESLDKVVGELNTIELEKYELESTIQQLTSEKESAMQSCESLKHDSSLVETELNELKEQLQRANAVNSELEDYLARIQVECDAKNNEIKALVVKAEKLRNSNAVLQEQVQITASENADELPALQQTAAASSEKIKSLEELLSANIGELNNAKVHHEVILKQVSDGYGAGVEQLKIRLSTATNIINSMKNQLDTQTAAENILKVQYLEKCRAYELQIQGLKDENDNAKKSEQLSQSQITELDRQYIEEIDDLKKHLLEFTEDMKSLKTELEEKNATESAFKDKLHDLQTENNNMKSEFIAKLSQMQDEAETMKSEIRAREEEVASLKGKLARIDEVYSRQPTKSRLPLPKRAREEVIDLIEVKKISRTISQTFQDISNMAHDGENASETSNGRRSFWRVGQIIVSFSGFRDDQPVYNTKLKHDLAEKLKSLGAVVKMDGEFEDKITHVLTPPGCRTLKSFAASLTSKWLITNTAWVIDSFSSEKFVNESRYGERFTERPFKDKSFYLADSFMKECRSGKEFRVDNAKNLITVLGGGFIVKSINAADNVIRGGSDSSDYPDKNVYTWSGIL